MINENQNLEYIMKKFFNMNFIKECASLRSLKTVNFHFNHKTLIIMVTEYINVVIVAHTGHSETYTGFDVKIVSKEFGEIDSCYFDFSSFLPRTCRVGKCNELSYSIERNSYKYSWYGTAPSDKDINEMLKRIIDYVNIWA